MKKKVVIIGAGTAGLVIAKNLQEKFDVTVLEKSKYKSYPKIFQIPLLIGILFRDPKKKYISKREINLRNGRKIPFYESNILGGASPMNGCVHTMGSRVLWDELMSKYKINYNDVENSFNNIFSYKKSEIGKINLSILDQDVIDDVFIETLNKKGISKRDMNFSDQEGCGPIHVTANKYFRSSVLSLVKKKKFKIFMNENVERLKFDMNKKIHKVITNLREIKVDYLILSGGVIGTCNLLLRTKKDLKDKGIDFLQKHPIGVGVKDHPNLRVNVVATQNIGSLNEVDKNIFKKFLLMLKHICGISTLMKSTGASSGVHLDLDGDGKIDTRIQIVNFTETGRHGSDGKYFGENPGFSLSISPIITESSGNITLSDNDIKINPEYCSSPKDVSLLKKALFFCIEILKSKPLSNFVLEIEKEDEISTNPEKYIQENYFSGHHLLGGTQDCIDSDFKLNGFENLYICDASSINNYIASNIHSTVVTIADLYSKKFLKVHQTKKLS